jgi:hypothetical protein
METTIDIATCNKSVHQILQNEKISHTFHQLKHRDWSQANEEIYNFLECYNKYQTIAGLPEMLDIWSHWLVSEINQINLIGEAISSVCKRRENTTLIVKHALPSEDFMTMQKALLRYCEQSISKIVDWDVLDV